MYNGRVVSITKFGAFVNILPGRDGLVHISKLGKGKRINNVEDVLELGQEIEVRVDDIDDKGKVSLTPVGEGYDGIDFSQVDDGGERRERRDRDDRGSRGGDRNRGGRDRDRGGDRGERRERSNESGDVVEVSFEDQFDSEIANELGDLGPGGRAGGNDRDDRGGRGGDRNRRRR